MMNWELCIGLASKLVNSKGCPPSSSYDGILQFVKRELPDEIEPMVSNVAQSIIVLQVLDPALSERF